MASTGTFQISKERLNQIAGKKLAALGVSVQFSADHLLLEGLLQFSPQARVANPVSGLPIAKARFQVEGHDHLRFVEPPLSALPPIPFFDAEKLLYVEERVAQALQKRLAVLEGLVKQLRALKCACSTDPEQLVVVATVDTIGYRFELLARPESVSIRRVLPTHGKPFPVPETFPPLKLEEFEHSADLEVHLTSLLPQLEQAAKSAPRPQTGQLPAITDRGLVVVAPKGLTVGLLQRFGGKASFAPNATLEVQQEFELNGARFRFVASSAGETLFRGRLLGPKGELWNEKFDLQHFPGISALVSSALGVTAAPGEAAPAPATAPPAPAARPAPPPPPPSLSSPGASAQVGVAPQPGELWVMDAVVEQESGEEVRYVCMNADGSPYGAARILARAIFEQAFCPHRGGWRLLISIQEVRGELVLYRQLDRERRPREPVKQMQLAVLTTNFVPEAAAY